MNPRALIDRLRSTESTGTRHDAEVAAADAAAAAAEDPVHVAAAALLGMKPREVAEVVDHEDGTLITTTDGVRLLAVPEGHTDAAGESGLLWFDPTHPGARRTPMPMYTPRPPTAPPVDLVEDTPPAPDSPAAANPASSTSAQRETPGSVRQRMNRIPGLIAEATERRRTVTTIDEIEAIDVEISQLERELAAGPARELQLNAEQRKEQLAARAATAAANDRLKAEVILAADAEVFGPLLELRDRIHATRDAAVSAGCTTVRDVTRDHLYHPGAPVFGEYVAALRMLDDLAGYLTGRWATDVVPWAREHAASAASE